mmetsp:Transcript_2469/g.6230  ORF Transcript_2469/g.6230 Transcript_2469/m.6230 type:complete len:203 (-) Transcript_2469:69-677(-)
MKNVATPAALAAAKVCNAVGGFPACIAAQETYSLGLMMPYFASGYNVYDMRIRCEKPPLCYDFSNISTYLNNPDVKRILGVEKKWTECDKGVQLSLISDFMKNYQQRIPELLEAGIEVLIYAGDQDYICNWLGNKAWTLALDWSGRQAFNQAEDEPFMVDGKEVGKLRSANGFSFMQVYQAGHMVPRDQPEAALGMLRKFTN